MNKETERKLKAFEVIKSYISVYKDDNGICWLSMMGNAIGIPQEEYDVLKEELL